jgi:hypothetical protein
MRNPGHNAQERDREIRVRIGRSCGYEPSPSTVYVEHRAVEREKADVCLAKEGRPIAMQ